jgi:hypothetical protein
MIDGEPDMAVLTWWLDGGAGLPPSPSALLASAVTSEANVAVSLRQVCYVPKGDIAALWIGPPQRDGSRPLDGMPERPPTMASVTALRATHMSHIHVDMTRSNDD